VNSRTSAGRPGIGIIETPVFKNPLVRFLMRGLGCLAVGLAIWWILLMDPMLNALRLGTEFAMQFLPGDGAAAHAAILKDGNWLMQMPVPASVASLDSTQQLFGRASKDGPPVKVRSLKLPIQGTFPVIFLVSFPVFWALWIAAPRKGATWRGFLIANSVLALISVVSLVFYSVYTAVEMLHLMPAGTTGFLWFSGRYMAINVAPYASPVLLALWFHPGLQRLIFSGDGWAPDPVATPVRRRARAR
jgi:hypothetical protein